MAEIKYTTTSGYGATITATLTYNVTTTDTNVTIKFTTLALYIGTGVSSATMSYSVPFGDGNSSIDQSIATGEATSTGNLSKTINILRSFTFQRGKSDYTKSVLMQGLYRFTKNGGGPGNTSWATGYTQITIPRLAQYTVTYNANGGTGVPASQTKWHGETITLSMARPSRSNYQFYRWNTKSDNTGIPYDSGAKYTSNSTATLYAIWNPTVTYDANGGTGAPAMQVKTYGQSLRLSTTKPTRANYVFYHWCISSNNIGTTYNSGAYYTENTPLYIYAIWNPVISYDANGGSGAPSSQTKTYGQDLTLQSSVPTRAGYEFTGWNTVKYGTGTTYQAGGTYESNTAVKLYAQWRRVHTAPTIPSMTVMRWDSTSNKASDTGTTCKVNASWTIDTSVVSSATLRSVTGRISPAVNGTTEFTPTVTANQAGTSGSATAMISGCDVDTQYTVTITVTDNQQKSGVYYSTSRSDILTRADFTLDFKAGGKAMGIGTAAPEAGLAVGWDTEFEEDVEVDGKLTVGGNVKIDGTLDTPMLKETVVTSDVATSSNQYWSITSQRATVYGKVVSVLVEMSVSTTIAAMTSTSVCVISSAYRPVTKQGFGCKVGIGEVGTSGSVSLTNISELATNSSVQIGLTYLTS